MALSEHSTHPGSFLGRLFGGLHAGAATQPASRVYRCAGCGEEITFDALAVSCRCSDECYGAAGAPRSAEASLHH